MNETAIANLSVALAHVIASSSDDTNTSIADRFYGWVARCMQPFRR